MHIEDKDIGHTVGNGGDSLRLAGGDHGSDSEEGFCKGFHRDGLVEWEEDVCGLATMVVILDPSAALASQPTLRHDFRVSIARG